MKQNFEVLMTEEVIKFLDKLDKKARDKIHYNIKKAKYTNNPELLKKLSEYIWEFRTKYNNIQYRLLAFWDSEKKSIIICSNGFIKKTPKTPKSEIKKAEAIRREYLKSF